MYLFTVFQNKGNQSMCIIEKLDTDFDRAAKGIPCKCKGYAKLVDSTQEECDEHGCGRDRPGYECCARSFECLICGTRIVGAAEAPEMS